MTRQAVLSAIIVLLVLAATATGIFYQTEGSQIAGVSARGQAVTYQGSGLYKFDPVYFVREGVVWDCINLFVGLPLFAIASVMALSGSLRGKLFVGGLLAYFFYVSTSAAP